MRSIQRRLTLGLGAALLAVGLVAAQTSLWLLDLGLRRYREANLREESETLLLAVERGAQGVRLNELRLAPAYQRPYSGRYFRIDFADGRHWRSRSLWDDELGMPAAGLQSGLAAGPQGQQLLVYRADYHRAGEQLSIIVAEDYSPVLEGFRQVRLVGLCLGGLGLALILLLQRWIVRRSLAPLERARCELAQLQQGRRANLDSEVPEELEPLVSQINRLLAHTEQHLHRSRTALGNLGHALKTPLAVLASLARRPEVQSQPALRQVLDEQVELMRGRLARELGRARLAGDVLPTTHFDCAEELPALLDTLRMVHGQSVALSWQAPPGLRIRRDREDVLELLGNLLDNACKWARQAVHLEVLEEGEQLLVRVDDDGPGIDAERREAVLARGVRLDEQSEGHGLGLGIVRDIVEAWRGELRLLQSARGGLRVEVELPR